MRLHEEDLTVIMKQHSGASTHIGRRSNNEDAHCTAPEIGLHIVADGMGGYEGGEIASHLVVDSIRDFFRRNAQDKSTTWPYRLNPALTLMENMTDVAIRLAHREISSKRTGVLANMGSTVALVVVLPHQAIVAHVGDSRVYRMRRGKLEQLTLDHSLYNELKRTGAPNMPAEEDFIHKNVITRALGLGDGAQPDIASYPLEEGDRFLLCTDGLSGSLSESRMAELMVMPDPNTTCEKLVESAFELGAQDNITVVVVRCDG